MRVRGLGGIEDRGSEALGIWVFNERSLLEKRGGAAADRLRSGELTLLLLQNK